MTPISSLANPTIKHAAALLTQHRIRKKSGQTVLEGVHLIEAAIKQNFTIKQIIIGQSALSHPEVTGLIEQITQPIILATDAVYKQIRSLGTGVDIMAIVEIPTPALGVIASDCLILDGLQDLGNIGTLLRTASAVGISTIISTTGTAHLWSPKCLRAGMGAHFSLAIFEQVDYEAILQKVKIPLYATSSHTDKVIYQHNLTQPIAWVLGHEGQGVSEIFLRTATAIALPQPNGQESLNVGVAGSVCFYEMLRQRQFAQH